MGVVMRVLPGDLVSATAGPILRRYAPVFWRDEETRYVVTLDPFREANAKCWGVIAAPNTWPCLGVWDDAGNFALDLSDPAGMDLATRWYATHTGRALNEVRGECWTPEHLATLCLAAVGRTS